ncbi:MAG TPA: molybdopterin-dependent oxidoreductase [Vicinamibacteria bacterium]|nr:molybdopterin-dependent oxidoreductase [Vicinamibacteria bacterium]
MQETLPWAEVRNDPTPRAGVRFTDLTLLDGGVVPNDRFFVLQQRDIPQVEATGFKLSISEENGREAAFALDEIRSLDKVETTVCFECAGNGPAGMHGLVGNARWGGARLGPLLEGLEIAPSAREVVFYGADNAEERLRGQTYATRFARSLPIRMALDENVLLAYEMNGEPLPREHGFPLRLIVPGWYGVAQVKWLTRIEIVPYRFMGWFMAKDYVTLRGVEVNGRIEHRATSVGRHQIKSVITRVTRDSSGAHTIHGLAWSDGSPIERIEISIDDGPFRGAQIEPASPYAWSAFHLEWTDASRGSHRLLSRARGGSGVQPTEDEDLRYKATPWENNGQVVRVIELS